MGMQQAFELTWTAPTGVRTGNGDGDGAGGGLDHFRIETSQYTASLTLHPSDDGTAHPILNVSRHGTPLFKLPLLSALEAFRDPASRSGAPSEVLTNPQIRSIDIRELPSANASAPVSAGSRVRHLTNVTEVQVVVEAESDAWDSREFRCTLFDDRIEYQHHAAAVARVREDEDEGVRLGRCFFFASGHPEDWAWAEDTLENVRSRVGVDARYVSVRRYLNIVAHTEHVRQVFSPKPNHGNSFIYSPAMSQSVGVLDEAVTPQPAGHHPEFSGTLFCPPPFAFAFGGGFDNSLGLSSHSDVWCAVGLGDQPGKYLFNAFDYSGSRPPGAAFWVNYNGYRRVREPFSSPCVSMHFGHSQYEALEKYARWTEQKGFATTSRFPNARWHREPVFCGWGEQAAEGMRLGVPSATLCTQALYERWVRVTEERGIPFGTVVIDDKWQKSYGTFEVDEEKWPDMRGFLSAQHAKGRRVLLWAPSLQVEGLPDEWLVKVEGKPVSADVTHPEYAATLRSRILALMGMGVDGFKVDWTGGLTKHPNAVMHKQRSPLYGVEFLRRFHTILYDAAHEGKRDALVETHCVNPLFRACSDVTRLNDIYFGTRGCVAAMKVRARIARLCGWKVLDCDAASCTTLAEWWDYMVAQPGIGVPSLYCVERMESTLEEVDPWMWEAIRGIWGKYRRDMGLEVKDEAVCEPEAVEPEPWIKL
ncbi:hypothetical protein HK101_007913 [Irineochytrium annulatum]|nr:hypothetical protein HK101_007913 [Irineochytrium annulatum]